VRHRSGRHTPAWNKDRRRCDHRCGSRGHPGCSGLRDLGRVPAEGWMSGDGLLGIRPGNLTKKGQITAVRVLHLPVNIASFASHTVRGLRNIGVDARGLVLVNAPVQSEEGLRVFTLTRGLRAAVLVPQGFGGFMITSRPRRGRT